MDNTTTLDFAQETFERCPHDRINPYAMINNSLIRDDSISFACRGLLIYLLSNKEGWTISIKQLINHCVQTTGKTKIYSIINEAISAGYIQRKVIKCSFTSKKGVIFKNLKRYKYTVSEFPKFKESFQYPENQDTESADPENGIYKNTISKNTKESIEDKDYVSKKDVTSDNVLLVSSDSEVGHITTYFFDRLKEIHPKIKSPNLKAWSKQMHLLLKTDNHSEQEVKQVIDHIIEQHKNPKKEFTWSMAVRSPDKLRKHFGSIWSEMHKPNQDSDKIEVKPRVFLSEYEQQEFVKICDQNKELAEKCYIKLSEWKIRKNITMSIPDFSHLCQWVITSVKNESTFTGSKKSSSHHGLQKDFRPRDPSKTIDLSNL